MFLNRANNAVLEPQFVVYEFMAVKNENAKGNELQACRKEFSHFFMVMKE